LDSPTPDVTAEKLLASGGDVMSSESEEASKDILAAVESSDMKGEQGQQVKFSWVDEDQGSSNIYTRNLNLRLIVNSHERNLRGLFRIPVTLARTRSSLIDQAATFGALGVSVYRLLHA
jgi:hypothetical protein